MEQTVFSTLNSINVNDKTEKKNGLTYLAWAFAWGEVKKHYPNATYTIYERDSDFGPINYFTDGMTCWVKTGVTIEGLEHIEYLPVMDYRNQSIPLEKIKSFDVNKAIQRSLTKAVARHGLGLYIYAGEDLPEDESNKGKEISDETKELATKIKGYLNDLNDEYKKLVKVSLSRHNTTKLTELPIQELKGLVSCAEQGKNTFAK